MSRQPADPADEPARLGLLHAVALEHRWGPPAFNERADERARQGGVNDGGRTFRIPSPSLGLGEGLSNFASVTDGEITRIEADWDADEETLARLRERLTKLLGPPAESSGATTQWAGPPGVTLETAPPDSLELRVEQRLAGGAGTDRTPEDRGR